MELGTISVTGKGGVHIPPDVTRLLLTLTTIHDSYDEAYQQAADNSSVLAQIMADCNLDTHLPKTQNFDIDKKVERIYDQHHNYVEDKFIGFVLNQTIKIDLGMDAAILNRVVRLIGKRLRQAELSIGHTVKDQRPYIKKMMSRATRDALEKAQLIVEALGEKLGPVKNVDYAEHEITIYSQCRQMRDAQECECATEASLDVTPDDLAFNDSVTVTWFLAPR